MHQRYNATSGSTPDVDSVDVDLIGARSALPREMRQRAGGGSVQKRAVQRKFRPMARAYEMPLAVVICVRAAEVRARDCEGAELSLVAGQVAGECRIAGGISLTPLGHDEGHPGRRLEARDPALMQRIHRRVERNADLVLRLVWITRRKDVNRKRCHHGDYRGGQYRRHPPAKKSS